MDSDNGYILLRCRTGLNDCLYELWTCTHYAIKHNRKIILQFMLYNTTDLNTIFNFKNYPVEIILNTKILENLIDKKIIPEIYKSQLINPTDMKQTHKYADYKLNNSVIDFDRNRRYPNDVLLVRDGFGRNNNFMSHMKYIRFSDDIIDRYNNIISTFPKFYNSMHIRSTDKSDVYKNNILMGIYEFIKNTTLDVFIASDDYNKISILETKYSTRILKTQTTFYNKQSNDLLKHQFGNLHQYGLHEPLVLRDAVIDLLLLSSANKIYLTTEKSGYSKLARFLCNNKDELNTCISKSEEIVKPKTLPYDPLQVLLKNRGVINVFICGLGNRMFMLATAYALAKYNNLSLYLGKHEFNKHSKHNYNETIFKYIGIKCEVNDLYNKLTKNNYTVIDENINHLVLPFKKIVNKGIVLKGQYQKFSYFNEYEAEISDLFLKGLEPNITKMSIKYNTENTGFLHIRRGDYLSEGGRKMFKQPNIEYYNENVLKLNQLNPAITKIFIFSNDIDFIKSKDYFNNPLFEIIEESDELDTLALMSLCKAGAIITNSTFGWWGAFLGSHLAKNPVFVFKNWFKNGEGVEVVPESWIRV